MPSDVGEIVDSFETVLTFADTAWAGDDSIGIFAVGKVTIPATLDSLLNSCVFAMIADRFGAAESPIAALEKRIATVTSEFAKFTDEDSMYAIQHADQNNRPIWFQYDTIAVLEIDTTEDRVTFVHAVSSYTGGAHGLSERGFSAYRLSDSSRIRLADLYGEEKLSAVRARVDSTFREERNLSSDTSLAEAGFFVDEAQLPLSAEVAILSDSLVFWYNPYVVAPYSVGPIRVAIPRPPW